MAELLDRARLLVAAGPYSVRAAETAAVHAAIYPGREAVCETCPAELGKAYFAIKRWLDQQDKSFSTSTSSTVSKNTSTARFTSDTLTYTPHGLGVAYTNDNLTDEAARYILKHDPDAKQFFKTLPADAEDGEDEAPAASEPAQSAAPAASTQGLTAALPQDFDYTALARAMVDELERREQERRGQDEPKDLATPEQPALTASTGGTDDASTSKSDTDNANTSDADDDHDGEKPVRLSRMNKEQLTAAYTAELGQAPAEGLTNDELRDAITEKRASQQDPE